MTHWPSEPVPRHGHRRAAGSRRRSTRRSSRAVQVASIARDADDEVAQDVPAAGRVHDLGWKLIPYRFSSGIRDEARERRRVRSARWVKPSGSALMVSPWLIQTGCSRSKPREEARRRRVIWTVAGPYSRGGRGTSPPSSRAISWARSQMPSTGSRPLQITHDDGLFGGLDRDQPVWMSHGDSIGPCPEGFPRHRPDRIDALRGARRSDARICTASNSTPRSCTPRRARHPAQLRPGHRRATKPDVDAGELHRLDGQRDPRARRRARPGPARRQGHLRAVGRGRFGGRGGARPPGGRRSADVHLRRPRPDAQEGVRAGSPSRRTSACDCSGRCPRAVLGQAWRGAAHALRLVDDDRVAALDLDLVGEALAPAGDDLHRLAQPRSRPSNRAGSSTSAKRAIA